MQPTTEPLNSRYMCNGSVLNVFISSFSPIRPTPRTGSSRRKESVDAITYAGVWGRKHGRSSDPVMWSFPNHLGSFAQSDAMIFIDLLT
ncbi:hypothetical protein N7488_002602 [Penicillium malachiteum]|nr:hypothetical protein N7488_002602 [Penicillium malachiteum]